MQVKIAEIMLLEHKEMAMSLKKFGYFMSFGYSYSNYMRP